MGEEAAGEEEVKRVVSGNYRHGGWDERHRSMDV
jgi:hypothetical protein